jgi:flagellin
VTQGSLQFQVGSEVGQTAAVNVTGTAANKLGVGATGLETSAQTVADIDVTTTAGARDAVRLIDQAIKQVSTVRGDLGAVQKNVFESAINSLSIAVENIMASESSIRDTDIAAEISEFTKAQILMNSSIAMLAQANQAPQALLQLLR